MKPTNQRTAAPTRRPLFPNDRYYIAILRNLAYPTRSDVLANHPLAFLDPIDLAPPGYNNELSTFQFVYDPVLDVLCTAFADRKFSIGGGKKKKQRRTKRADGNGSSNGNKHRNDNGNGNGNGNDNGNDNSIDGGDGSHNDNDYLANAHRKASVPRELRKRLRKCHPEEIVRKFEGELISFLDGLQLDRKECAGHADSTCTSAAGKDSNNATTPSHHSRDCSDEWVVVHEVNDSDASQINGDGVVVVGKEDHHSDLRVSVVRNDDHRPLQEKPPRAVGTGEDGGRANAEKQAFLVWDIGDGFSRWVVHKMCGYYHLLSFSRNAEGGRRLTYVYHPAYAPEELLRRERVKGRKNARFVRPEKSFFEYLFP